MVSASWPTSRNSGGPEAHDGLLVVTFLRHIDQLVLQFVQRTQHATQQKQREHRQQAEEHQDADVQDA
jgi:hypothetical protein